MPEQPAEDAKGKGMWEGYRACMPSPCGHFPCISTCSPILRLSELNLPGVTLPSFYFSLSKSFCLRYTC